MPDQSSNLASIRTDNHFFRGYLSVYDPATVLTGTVSATPTYPITAIAYTLTTGSEVDVKPGFRVSIFTSTNKLKGTTRIRYAGTISSTSLPVRELSLGSIEIVSGDLVAVYEDVVLSDKLTAATSGLEPDGITYTDQTDAHRPVACSGGADAGFVDSGQAYRTVQFTGSTSYTVDPDSVSAITHAWTFPTGSSPASSTSADPSAQIPVGNHLIVHTVTDPDNSTTQIQYVPVIVHDSNSPPHKVEFEALASNVESAWSGTVRLFENATLANIRDGSLAILWVEEFIAGVLQSFGPISSGREHIRLMGYLFQDNEIGNADGDEIFFDIQSPLMALGAMFGTSKAFENNANPSTWQQYRSLTTRRAIIQIFQWYTTFIEAGWDLIFANSTYFYEISAAAIYLQASSPLSMAREVAAGVDARIVEDRTGRLLVHTRPEHIKENDRSAVVRTVTLEDDDIITYSVDRQHNRPIAVYRSRGIISTSGQPAFAKWPGEAPGELRETLTKEKMFFTDLTDLYERTGLRGAAADSIVWQSDDSVLHVSELTLELAGPYDFFDFYQEFIQISLTRTNLRGFLWNKILWILNSIDITYEDGGTLTTLRLKPATLGPPGVDDTPPFHPIAYTPITPIDFDDLEPLSLSWGLNPGTGNILLVLSDGTIALTTNFSAASPNWTVRDFSGTLGSTVFAYTYRAAQPVNITAWIVTDTEIWHAVSLQDASPTFTLQHTLAGAAQDRRIDSDYIHSPGLFAVVRERYSDRAENHYTLDGGTTWTGPVTIDSRGGRNGGIFISTKTFGKVWTDARVVDNHFLYVSTDKGASWSEYGSLSQGKNTPIMAIHEPFASVTTETVFYSGGHVSGITAPKRLWRSVNAGASRDTISPIVASVDYGWCEYRGIGSADDDANKLAIVGKEATAAGTNRGVFITANALASTPVWTTIDPIAVSNPYRSVAFVNNGQELYVYGADGNIGYTSTPFVPGTVLDKLGDLVTTATVVGIAGY